MEVKVSLRRRDNNGRFHHQLLILSFYTQTWCDAHPANAYIKSPLEPAQPTRWVSLQCNSWMYHSLLRRPVCWIQGSVFQGVGGFCTKAFVSPSYPAFLGRNRSVAQSHLKVGVPTLNEAYLILLKPVTRILHPYSRRHVVGNILWHVQKTCHHVTKVQSSYSFFRGFVWNRKVSICMYEMKFSKSEKSCQTFIVVRAYVCTYTHPSPITPSRLGWRFS